MPPKKGVLHPGQLATADVRALEQYVVDELGEAKRYRQLVDPESMAAAGAKNTRAPCRVPRFVLIVDTAEQDYEFLVRRLRGMGVWAVARSMKRPPSEAYAENFFAGDFATLQWIGCDDDDDDKCDDKDHAVPRGYVCLVDAERKTLDDLIASFGDQRRARQRAEHAASSARRHVYLIEGNMDELTDRKAVWIKNINSDLDHLVYDGGFHVRQINTHADLLPTLYNMVRYPAKGVLDAESNITPMMAFSLSGKNAKQRDLNSPATIWAGMLQAVPGVSAAAAGAIMKEYPTMVAFARDLVAADDDDEERARITRRLRDVDVPTQNSSSSRSSTRLASRADKLMHMAVGTEMKVSNKPQSRVRQTSRKKRIAVSDSEDDYDHDSFVEDDPTSDSDDDDSDYTRHHKKPQSAKSSSSSSSSSRPKPSALWSDSD